MRKRERMEENGKGSEWRKMNGKDEKGVNGRKVRERRKREVKIEGMV